MPVKLSDVLQAYKETKSIEETAVKTGLSTSTVKKALITQGVYPTPNAKQVARLRLMDMSDEEIMDFLHMSPKALFNYTPYSKGSYVIGEKSANALRIAKTRSKKAVKK